MKKKLLILLFLFSYFIQVYAQCPKADEYDAKIKKIENMTPTERVHTGSDMQGYHQFKAWYSLKCECDKGWYIEKATNTKKWRTPEQAEAIKNNMNAIRQTISRLYSNLGSVPPVISSCKCGNSEGSASSNNGAVNTDPKAGVIVNDQYMSLLNDIASDSKNPNFKTMVDDMNRNSEIIGKGRDFALQTGTMKKGDVDYYNNLENIAQGVAVAKFIYNSISNKPPPLTPEQLAGRKTIIKLSEELRSLYNQISGVPTFYEFDNTVLDKLNDIEHNISRYEEATATRRLLYLEYWYTKPYLTNQEIFDRYNQLESLQRANGTDYIKSLIKSKEKSFKEKEFVHIVDKEYGFRNTYDRIVLTKANYYDANGDKKKAKELRESVNYDVNNFDAFRFLAQNFKEKNYYGSIEYYKQVKEVLRANENRNSFFLYYKNIPSIDYSALKGINIRSGDLKTIGTWRHEATFLLALGVLSYSSIGDEIQAQQEFEFLQWFNENHRLFNEKYKAMKSQKKANSFTDVDYETSYGRCLAIEKAVESILLSKKNDFDNAKIAIDKCILLNNENPTTINKYELWFLLTELEVSIRVSDYVEAKKTAIKIKNNMWKANAIRAKLFSVEDYQFLMAYMKFKQNKYQSALSSLGIMETEHPNSIRVLSLTKDIYQILGNAEKVNEYEIKLLN